MHHDRVLERADFALDARRLVVRGAHHAVHAVQGLEDHALDHQGLHGVEQEAAGLGKVVGAHDGNLVRHVAAVLHKLAQGHKRERAHQDGHNGHEEVARVVDLDQPSRHEVALEHGVDERPLHEHARDVQTSLAREEQHRGEGFEPNARRGLHEAVDGHDDLARKAQSGKEQQAAGDEGVSACVQVEQTHSRPLFFHSVAAGFFFLVSRKSSTRAVMT